MKAWAEMASSPANGAEWVTKPTVSVVVTTYRRMDRLAACLEGLGSQTRPAEEVIVVVHAVDEDSAVVVERVASEWPAVRCVRVDRRGLVAAYNHGLAASRGSIVAFVDDDAVPSANWLEAIVRTFEQDERIAAVGGRDLVVAEGRVIEVGPRRILDGAFGASEVGRIQWFGRMIGNHHLGVGKARDVDVLKGVNMSFRRAAVARHGFDERLQGRGVEIHSELSVCLPLRRKGLRVVYDPRIVVRHYPAPRRYGYSRDEIGGEAMRAAVHNEALAILEYFDPPRRLIFMAWGFVSGATHAPGLFILVRDLAQGRPAAWSRFNAAQRGRLTAWGSRRTERSIPVALREAAARQTAGHEASNGRERGEPTTSVVVATYRRTDQLAACLAGLRSQTRPPDEIVVVVHSSDEETARLVEEAACDWPALRGVQVDRHGSVAAYNRGLGASRGSIVAFVDDDAVPSENWLEAVIRTFGRDERISAVGGRDLMVAGGRVIEADGGRILAGLSGAHEVGRIQWFGRMIGNHHLGVGEARDVDVLKGVNMSFRREAVIGHGFDERLRGRGTQMHSELSICLPLRRRGLRLVYDPAIIVHHYPAPRGLGDRREDHGGGEVMLASAHNEALAILEHFGSLRRLMFMGWGFVCGATHAPGLAVLARDLAERRPAAWSRFSAAQRGRLAAWKTRRTARGVPAALVVDPGMEPKS